MDWKTINSFAPWFAAIGTICSAIVALYLGLRLGRPKLRVTALHKVFMWEGGTRKDYLEIRIVNVGFARAILTGVDFEWGFIKKKQAVFRKDFEPNYSDKFPIQLEYGQDAKYYFPWELWVNVFTEEALSNYPRLMVSTMRLRVWTTIGQIFGAPIQEADRKDLLKAVSEARKAAKKKS